MKILTCFRHPSLEACLRKISGVEWVAVPTGQLTKAALTVPADLVLVQASNDYIKGWRPMIVSDGTLGPGTLNNHWREVLSDKNVRAIVFNTPEQIWAWQVPANRCTVIPRGIELSRWPLWTGGTKRVVSAVNMLKQRDAVCGYTIWDKSTHDLPRWLFGWGNEVIGKEAEGVMGKVEPAELGQRLQQAHVFLNTTISSAAPNALIEAMAVGIPIVSTKTYFSYAHLGNRAFISNDPNKLRNRVKELLDNPEPMRAAGVRNRALVTELFNMDTAVYRWSSLIHEVMGR